MISGVWGKKIGMTQIFDGDIVVPVTAIDVEDWIVTGIKKTERDGYEAVQIGCLKERYSDKDFSQDWVKKPTKYFNFIREVKLKEPVQSLEIGQKVDFHKELPINSKVDVFGITKGCGFAGAVKRHGFAGAPASHGATMGRRPGSVSGPRRKGKILKGKRLPGHMGVKKRVMQGLSVVKIVDTPNHVVLIKGSVPGKAGSLVFIRKALN
ncbi:MAG: 50S ribosomal protein L3 [bacterium]|nr:50S ribosomal protein L3 [bacterium]